MAQLTVRNLDDQVYARLKERAKANKRSLEAEARAILEANAVTDRAEFARWAEEFRKQVKPGKPGEVTAWIREDRDRR
jgi:plasmid stability protein